MTTNEKPGQRFSKNKADLKPGEFDEIIDYNKIKALVLANREKVMNSEIAKRGLGIFRFPNFEKFFSLDGSIISKEKPEELFSLDFFRKPGRIATKELSHKERRKVVTDNTYYLRGQRYLAAINPNLETRQRLDILLEDFVDGVYFLQQHSHKISDNESVFKQELAILDYIKNSAIVVLNTLIQNEKLGIFRLEDKKYQNMRNLIIYLTKRVVQMYFAYLIGNESDYLKNLDSVTKRFQDFENIILYLEQEYREGAINNLSFSRPEANHPLIIGASTILNAEKTDVHPDAIFSFPSGGTELALTQQYAFLITKNYEPQVVLMPYSLYSVSQIPKRKIADRQTNTPLEFLEQHRKSIDNREIMIVEDNSNTGNTIQRFYDLITANFKPKKVVVSVAEADVIRAKQLKDSKIRTTVASSEVFQNAVNILPVGKRKLKSEMKEDIERQRLIKECELNLRNAQDSTEKMMYSIFLKNLIEPTESILRKLTPENSIQRFSGTILSNYYVTSINYYGIEYTSTEKAYQAEKFSRFDLTNMPKEDMDFIQERFRCMGVHFDREDLSDFFTDPNTSSGMSKAIANILRARGFQKPEWENIKFKIMLELLQIKFSNPEMMRRLKETGDKYLVEGNDWGDIFWGVDNGVGKNMLGMALMYIRDGDKFLRTIR